RANLGEAVYHEAVKSELLHAPFQLARRSLGILHRQRREATEACGMAPDMLGEYVIRAPSHRNRLLGVGDALNSRRVEREDGEGRTAFIHSLQALLRDIEQTGFQPLPNRR